MKQHIKENGFKVKSKGKERSYLRVVVYFKGILKMILKKEMEKCTIIHQEIIFKVNGKMIKSKEKEL